MPAPIQRRSVETQKARLVMPGLSVVLTAADPKATKDTPRRWEMVLYSGGVYRGHWYWGDIILDVSGFKPDRQDLPALRNHDTSQVAGYSDKLSANVGKAEIRAEGFFLQGTIDQEPTADMIARRLSQDFPYQSSGRFEPRKVEQVLEGAKATVNGAAVEGPVTIFREFNLIEPSFTEIGWNNLSEAMAANAGGQETVSVEVVAGQPNEKETPMPEPIKTTTPSLLAMLKEIFGADKAITLVSSKPEAKELLAFIPELQEEVKTLRASGADLQTKLDKATADLAATKTELEAAKKAPPVITAGGDPSQARAPAPAAGSEAALKAEWDGSKDLQAEFPKVEYYLTHKAQEARRNSPAPRQA